MGYAVYKVGKRWGGYGVPAICEHPYCKEEINRGMSYACGGEPFSEYGCDRYFCSKHLFYTAIDPEQDDMHCKHEDDCECAYKKLCERCRDGKPNFEYKPEHPEWVKHLLKDPSWATWRKENPSEVEQLT